MTQYINPRKKSVQKIWFLFLIFMLKSLLNLLCYVFLNSVIKFKFFLVPVFSSFCLSLCLSVFLSVSLSVRLSLSISLFFPLSLSLSFSLSHSIYLSISLSLLFFSPSFYLSLTLSLSISPSFSFSPSSSGSLFCSTHLFFYFLVLEFISVICLMQVFNEPS